MRAASGTHPGKGCERTSRRKKYPPNTTRLTIMPTLEMYKRIFRPSLEK